MIYSFIITHSILLTTLPYTPHLFKFKLILNWWYIFPINYVDHASMIQFILCVWGSNQGNLLIKVNIMLVLVHFTQFSMLQVCLMSFFHPLHHLIVKNNMKFSIMRRCKSCSARPFPLLAIPAPPRDGSLLALPLHAALVYTRHHRHHHHIHHGSWAENTIFISESCTNIGSGDSLGIGPKTSLSCQ